MRRLDDAHGGGRRDGALPFKVLGPTDTRYLSAPGPPPPPARAPEPYKVAPSTTTTFGRSHRNSSFVILAEPRPATPDSRSPSPAGRLSPFRGRGFKGPAPRSRSRSRAQSPENEDATGKNERRGSLSQQYSPRRSLIPQPTRRRSISLTKTNDRSVSPKVGRRIDARNRLSVSTSNLNNNSTTGRQTPRQFTRLSPIQGTPTKPAEKPEKSAPQIRRDRPRNTPRTSPAKTPRNAALPPKSVSNPKKASQNQTSSRERLTSPSKIPLKTANTLRNGGSNSNLNTGRFISITNQPNDKTQGRKNDKGAKDAKKDGVETSGSNQQEVKSNGSRGSQENSSNASKTDDLVLLDLLRQSFNATATSSVVNTTTTTAVQPLKIDPNPIPIDRDAVDKISNNARNQMESNYGKTESILTSRNDSPAFVQIQNGLTNGNDKKANEETQRTGNERTTAKNAKPANGAQRVKTGTGSNAESPMNTDTVGGHSKNSSISQSLKNYNKVSREQAASNGSAGQRSNAKNPPTMSTQKSANNNNNNNNNNDNDNDEKLENESLQKPAPEVPQDGSDSRTGPSNETRRENDANRNMVESDKSVSTVLGNGKVRSNEARLASTTEQDARLSSKHDSSVTASAVNGRSNHASVEEARVVAKDDVVVGRKSRAGNGETYVQSSAGGESNGSDGSLRSVDTGVSVNTVRGVSSPREKTGVHLVKRPQEIETLSGNVMHFEQNGDPTVLAVGDVAETPRDIPESLLARWRKSLGRYGRCCPSMRCLACRRDPKGSLWPGRKQQRMVAQTSGAPITAETENDAQTPGCWTRFKNRCRCTRLQGCKCCSRRARVAPAESTATCCPSEGRFGAACRRLFSSCKCKRNNDQQRRQSIRAKHSLTSVAPPPLSERNQQRSFSDVQEPKSKLPEVLVEHNSVMRGAIPCLPVPLAWFCLVWNVLLPGTGTVWSGLFNLCVGQPRFSMVAGVKSRLGAFIVNLIVGVGQLFTVLFCLVGWGWSIWWGVMMVRLARKYKRFKSSEAANGDPEARPGESSALPPGVPSQALRGMERAR